MLGLSRDAVSLSFAQGFLRLVSGWFVSGWVAFALAFPALFLGVGAEYGFWAGYVSQSKYCDEGHQKAIQDIVLSLNIMALDRHVPIAVTGTGVELCCIVLFGQDWQFETSENGVCKG